MTTQLQMSTRTATLSTTSNTVANTAMVANLRSPSSNQSAPMQSVKCLYQADQQVKLLHLHAEIESLLVQLQALKRQRLEDLSATASYPAITVKPESVN